MKQVIAICLSLLLLLSLSACYLEDGVTEETRTYEIGSEIHTLHIRINAADFRIEEGECFSVESNLRYLSVTEESGVLTLEDRGSGKLRYHNPVLTLTVPREAVFDAVDLKTGAARITVDTLSTQHLRCELGAGEVRFGQLEVLQSATVKGGAGKLTVAGGSLRQLTLEMGVGELELRGRLLGSNRLELGVGGSTLTLLGDREDYRLELEKGLGSISVDGKSLSDYGSSGNGTSCVEIHGGIGSIHVWFEEGERA